MQFDNKMFETLLKETERFQGQIQETQKKIAQLRFTGHDAKSLVKITINGKHHIQKIQIHDSLLKNKTLLEEKIIEASNNAIAIAEAKSVDSILQEQMASGFKI